MASFEMIGYVGMIACLLITVFVLFHSQKWKRLAQDYLQHQQVLLTQLQTMNETFCEIRGQRHDMMAHISAIQHMLDSDEPKAALRYMQQLISVHHGVHDSIKGEEGHLASILYPIRLQAEQAGITVQYELEAPLSALPLPAVDQLRFTCNLLQNALGAAKEAVQQGIHGKLELHSTIIGGHYILHVSNTSPPIPAPILDHLFRKGGLTSKSGRHEGLGTYIIGQLVRRYKGKIDYRWDAPEFRVKIKLPIIKK